MPDIALDFPPLNCRYPYIGLAVILIPQPVCHTGCPLLPLSNNAGFSICNRLLTTQVHHSRPLRTDCIKPLHILLYTIFVLASPLLCGNEPSTVSGNMGHAVR